MSMLSKNDSAGAEPAKKNFWATIFVTTPVFFTIVATFLAGQSSGEMTRAQYHRSLASQNQSKVGDQWAFFQAKRGRGTSMAMTAELLESLKEPAPFEPETLPRAAEQLTLNLEKTKKQAALLVAEVGKAKDALGKENTGTLEAISIRLLQDCKSAVTDAGKTEKEINAALSPGSTEGPKGGKRRFTAEQVKTAFAALIGEVKKTKSAQSANAGQGDDLAKVVQAIKNRQPEQAIADLVLPLDPAMLIQAIDATEAKAQGNASRLKDIDIILGEVEKWVDRETKIARRINRDYQDLKLTLARASEKIPEAILGVVRELDRDAESLNHLSGELNAAFKVARLNATARRYEQDARDNQELAYLYEAKVYASSAASDRHLQRSKKFFFGMLAAQVAVTVATLAMAVRYKSILWGLATVAGLGAALFGGYILLDLG